MKPRGVLARRFSLELARFGQPASEGRLALKNLYQTVCRMNKLSRRAGDDRGAFCNSGFLEWGQSEGQLRRESGLVTTEYSNNKD